MRRRPAGWQPWRKAESSLTWPSNCQSGTIDRPSPANPLTKRRRAPPSPCASCPKASVLSIVCTSSARRPSALLSCLPSAELGGRLSRAVSRPTPRPAPGWRASTSCFCCCRDGSSTSAPRVRFLEDRLPHYHPLPGGDVYLTISNTLPGGGVEMALVHRALVPGWLPGNSTHLFTFGPPRFGRMFRAASVSMPPQGEWPSGSWARRRA